MPSFALSKYQLVPKGILGSHASARSRKGALLRVSFPDGSVGYGDCFPWPELGDLPLESHLDELRAGRFSDLIRCSLRCARVDAEARQAGKNLFKHPIPKSHFLMTDFSQLTLEGEREGAMDRIKKISALGFTRIKVKVGTRPVHEAQQLSKLLSQCSGLLDESFILLRLDFNGTLTQNEVDLFMETLGEEKRRIDFIEDPTPYDPEIWARIQKKWGIRLALDRMVRPSVPDLKKGSFSVLVLKPEIQDEKEWVRLAQEFEVPLVVTSALGHPLGQVYSAWVASQIARDHQNLPLEACGLISHPIYQPNRFSSLLRDQAGRLLPSKGNGLGFDSLLAELDWEKI